LRELGDYAQPKGVTVLIESHGDFTDSPSLLALLEQAASPSVALLWDAHHTFVSGKEQPEDTVRQLGRYIRHTHLKDSVPAGPDGKDRRYVLTGKGEVPVRRQIEALAHSGYRGFYNFEWEKRWHRHTQQRAVGAGLAQPPVVFLVMPGQDTPVVGGIVCQRRPTGDHTVDAHRHGAGIQPLVGHRVRVRVQARVERASSPHEVALDPTAAFPVLAE